jgi:hypothetical protein
MLKKSFLLCCLLCSQVQANSSYRLIESIADHATEIQSVWPGFVTSFNHAIYNQSGDIYLLSSLQELPGWELKDDKQDLYIWHKKSADLKQFKRSFFIQEALTSDTFYDGAQNFKAPIKTLFHESFHGFQDRAMAVNETTWSNLSISQHVIKIKQAEFNLLQQVMELNDADQLAAKIRLYVSLRAYREALMDAAAVTLERNMEWQEGVATYVGFSIGKIIDNKNINSALMAYGQRLKNNGQQQVLENFMRYDAYFHGAAICYLLNQFDPEWQTKINQGQTPFALLTDIYPAETLSQADVEDGLNLKANNPSFETADFDALESWKKVLYFDLKYTEGFGFVGKKIESKSNGTLVHDASKVHTESTYLKLTARAKRMFLTETQVAFKLSSSPNEIKNCEKVTVLEFRCEAGKTVKFGGIKLRLKQAMTLHKKQQQWHLTEATEH